MINKISKVIVISFFICLSVMIARSYYIGYKIDNYGQTIIGKYVLHKSYPKSQENHFIYYVNSKRMTNYSTENVSLEFKQNIGKFYKMKYLDEYPEAIHPIFDEEVVDTTEILNAGFSKEDL
ncbi:hypothetical protein D3C86_1569760 [compost metagenome]|jgi:hypothetical protein